MNGAHVEEGFATPEEAVDAAMALIEATKTFGDE